MTISYRTAVTIVQFIFFAPAAPLGVWLCFKDGLKQASTWRFVATLSILRVAGDISYFISLSHPGVRVETSVIVCELLGLAPLMLILVAFVARANQTTKSYPGKASLTITCASLSGLILGVVGTDRALERATTTSDVGGNKLIEAALGLFMAGYGIMLIGFFIVLTDVLTHPSKRIALGKEIGLLYTVALAAPFVLVRFIYSAIGDYGQSKDFSVLYGNNTAYLFMDVLMEISSVAICLSSAFFVPPPSKPVREEETEEETKEETTERNIQANGEQDQKNTGGLTTTIEPDVTGIQAKEVGQEEKKAETVIEPKVQKGAAEEKKVAEIV
ncbi:hypothetical protein ACHAO8_011422 [Botrytis cinerea]